MSDDLLRYSWEDEDAAPIRSRRSPALPDLLRPAVAAADAVARLEAGTAAASPAVVEGLRRRVALREASGWLAHRSVQLHPNDLALRDLGLTGSYLAAAHGGRLRAALPFTAATDAGEPATPEDTEVAAALRFARSWRRLAELRTWRPLASHDAVGEALAAIGWPADAELVAAWRDREAVPGDPPLVAALRAGQAWIGLAGHDDPLPLDAVFLAACGWRMAGYGEPVALPFWSADAMLLHRQAVQVGPAWLVGALGCVADAATRARAELRRLLAAERAAAGVIGRTVRSRLPGVAELLIRHPVVTAGVAARELDMTQQAAVRLLAGFEREGLAAETTGRRAFRAWMAATPRSAGSHAADPALCGVRVNRGVHGGARR